MKNTNWNLVKAGQIVQFQYQNIKGESSKRTTYVLAPRYRYRKKSTNRIVEFFIGLEIKNTTKRAVNPITLKEMFLEINNIFEDNDKTADYTDERVIKRLYEGLKGYLDSAPIFRTYFLRECRKRRVFLIEDSKDVGGNLIKVVDLMLKDKEEELERGLERALPDED